MNNNFETISNSQYYQQPDFQSVYTDSIKGIAKLYDVSVARYSFEKFNVVMPAMFLIDTIILIFISNIMGFGNYYLYILTAILFLCSLILSLGSYLFAFLRIKNIKTLNSGMLPETIVDFAEKIYITCGVTKQELNYADITSFIETKDTLYIIFNKRLFLYIPKNSFTKGDVNEFKNLIYSFVAPYKKNKFKMLFNIFLMVFCVLVTVILIILLIMILSGTIVY